MPNLMTDDERYISHYRVMSKCITITIYYIEDIYQIVLSLISIVKILVS